MKELKASNVLLNKKLAEERRMERERIKKEREKEKERKAEEYAQKKQQKEKEKFFSVLAENDINIEMISQVRYPAHYQTCGKAES
ncbi:hypothetical protein EJ02DRAFT_450003 [Clathrospora elynae]|uniref:Uncharacterized protein n=1 Tax=Clathrospora elynae TaxID=706981 RepID=A0A6A5T4D6_9PLEO|nr:hypothetical protein EJ02DRAFT_450003 [Clathrospora elynae]